MTKRKSTTDLEERIRRQVTPPVETPTDGGGAGSPDSIALAGYVQAIRDGDEAEIRRLAALLLFGPDAISLHRTLIEEHDSLLEQATDLDQRRADVQRLERQVARLQAIRPSTLAESEIVAEQLADAEQSLCRARNQAGESEIAHDRAYHLRRWAGPLFGESRPPIGLHHDSPTLQECERLGIDFRRQDAWRGRPAGQEGRRQVRIVNTTNRR